MAAKSEDVSSEFKIVLCYWTQLFVLSTFLYFNNIFFVINTRGGIDYFCLFYSYYGEIPLPNLRN